MKGLQTSLKYYKGTELKHLSRGKFPEKASEIGKSQRLNLKLLTANMGLSQKFHCAGKGKQDRVLPKKKRGRRRPDETETREGRGQTD